MGENLQWRIATSAVRCAVLGGDMVATGDGFISNQGFLSAIATLTNWSQSEHGGVQVGLGCLKTAEIAIASANSHWHS